MPAQGSSIKRVYYCDCRAHCRGQQRQVSQTTYYNHAPYRNQQLQDALRQANGTADGTANGAANSATGLQAGVAHRGKRRRIETAQDDSQAPGSSQARPRDPSRSDELQMGHGGSSRPSLTDNLDGQDPEQAPNSLRPFPFQDDEPEPPGNGSSARDRLDLSRDLLEPSRGLPDPSRGLPDPSRDLPDPSRALLDPSRGNQDEEHEDPEFGPHDETGILPEPSLEELKTAVAFVNALQTASLDASGLHPDIIHRMHHPEQDGELPDLAAPENRALRLALRQYITNGHSEKAYRDNRAAAMEYDPDLNLPTYETMQNLAQELSGVVPIITDMCPETCIAYTGPFADLDRCPYCGAERYEMRGNKQVAHRTFQTHPLGPQVQALYRSRRCAERMHYREKVMNRLLDMAGVKKMVEVAEDVFFAEEYLTLVRDGVIQNDDLVLMFSIDGAQLYESKQSDCWIYIWILFDLAPDLQYKKRYVLPGAFIPGPRKPRNVDSFLFPGLYHVAALQNTPLKIWDSSQQKIIHSRPIILFATADTPAMAYINGLVGHSGAHGCRLFCPLKGRRKPGGGGHYYPAMLKPADPSYERVTGSTHPDFSVRNPPAPDQETSSERYQRQLKEVLACPNDHRFSAKRLETGIAKPSIFMGLPINCGFPASFPADVMHLLALNVTELVIGLLRGTFRRSKNTDPLATWDWACYLDEDVWAAHGKLVGNASLYLPGSFDRPPRNPAEKISSGYKAWEWMYYVYGILPGLLWSVQKPKYYGHFCKLVSGVRFALLVATPVQLREDAHTLLVEYVEEFEEYYYARRADRLHFCRQALHGLTHLIPENIRVGPGWLHSQWALENAIGNLTAEIGSDSKPYENLSLRGLRRAQISALLAMFPDLEPPEMLPPGAIELGDSYVLLHPRMRNPRTISDGEEAALLSYLETHEVQVPGNWKPRLTKWGRLRLPNGQIARTAWKECDGERRGRPVHRSRMVKLKGDRFAEVQYFFGLKKMVDDGGSDELDLALAMVSLFTPPDPAIVRDTYGALMACRYQGTRSREVVDVQDIISVIAMVPLPPRREEREDPHADELYTDRYFVIEKLGFDMTWIGRNEEVTQEEEPGDDDD